MRTALITGASSGIGLALCHCYLQAGWQVVAHYRSDAADLQQLAASSLTLWQCDFTDTAALERDLAGRAGNWPAPDAIVSLAGRLQPAGLDTASAAEMLDALRVNALPAFLLMKRFVPAMLDRQFGRIVHGGSIGVKFGGGPDSFAYSLSKHALEFMPRATKDWPARNVLVNTVRIGVTDTDIHAETPDKSLAARIALIPARRAASPAEMARNLYWLGSEQNSFISGQIVSVSGGE